MVTSPEVDRASVLRESGAAASHLARICFKTGPPTRAGVELEWTVHDAADPARPVDGERLRAALGPHSPHTLDRTSPAEQLRHGSTVTVEPGGQLEISTAPRSSIAALIHATDGDIAEVSGLPDAARHVLTAVDRVRFAHVYVDGALVAIGRGTVTGQGRWLGLSLIEVVPAARRRGLARFVIHELVDWAAAQGATHAFLQVEQRNTGAVALYRGLGFTTHHTYLTRVAPPT
ncbi:GNAT family N-acetyltransferase [Micromonospora phytophila]|uniref:GNAT family N-acetyltransferase n=1 Tax=Micromonospora phytophila TaxID=709888 RepID=UPI003FD79E4B